MSTIINADTSDGLKFTSDTSGEIKLQSAGADIVSVTANGMAVDTNTLYVDATNNNVGINTSTLHHFGTGITNFTVAGSTIPIIHLNSTGGASNAKLWRWIARNDSTMQFQTLEDNYGGERNIWNVVRSGADISYQAWHTGASVERMRIDSSGRVGIGKTPSSVLSIQTTLQNFGGGLNLQVAGGSSNWEFVNGGDSKLYLGYAASGTPSAVGNFATNGTYTATSDIRRKKDITYTFNGLDIVNALKPAQGRMLEDEDTSPLRPMFIAQDMVDVIPSLVSNLEPEPSDNPLLGVDYASITPILVKAIQEQQEKITALETRIQALENA